MHQRIRRIRLALPAAAASLVLLTTACTGGSGTPAGAAPATESDIPSFTYAIPAMPTSLTGITTKVQTQLITSLVTEPLERVSLNEGTAQLQPNLATSARQVDPQTLVYTLRSGVKFSDGTPLTADDVAWSIKAAAAKTAETAGNMAGFAGATASGPGEVTVKWAFPSVNMRETVSELPVLEAAFATAHPDDLGTSAALPVGSGPYAYQSQTSQDISLKPNPNYWGTRPKAQNVKFTVIADGASAQLAMRSDSIQGSGIADLKTTTQWQGINGTTVYTAQNLVSDLLSMDTSKPPFNDLHVRQAVAYSIDRKGILAAAFGGNAEQLQTLVPIEELAGVMPSQAEAQQFLDSLPQYELDPAKAKAQLAQSAYPNGFSVTVPYINGSNWSRLLVLNLQQNMKPLGVTITPQPVPAGQWFQTFFSHQATGLQVLSGFSTTTTDPAGLLFGFVGAANMKPNLPNSANFTNDVIEKNYPAIAPATAGTYSKADRWAATKAILTDVAHQLPYIPLFSEKTAYALAKGYTFTQNPSLFDTLSGAWIDLLRSTT
ncbi:ABC transporter substrate-binding protein [Amycolatopsis saalfeldensis]|uniref:Peptide/nickel transport system substrate-binding protein n=1 Tax=Amycolatopsis saalfeldensis TaxID=394193 RepID=A0A1H8XXN2_9PSEU|nr:ABC transporter substrate-binding protein [Amycolatopsis saalfeldensis]SEP44557.1 peptide/nickel transport system substrate-binding protein [Amycolatopsis saalfeldensis]